MDRGLAATRGPTFGEVMRLPRAHPILSGSRRRSLFAPFAVVLALLMAISNAGVVFAWSNLTFSSGDEAVICDDGTTQIRRNVNVCGVEKYAITFR